MIKVDKNIPIPNTVRGGHVNRYPFDHLEPGDSFLMQMNLSGDREADKTAKSRSTGLVSYAARKYKHKYATRLVEGGRRVWRIA